MGCMTGLNSRKAFFSSFVTKSRTAVGPDTNDMLFIILSYCVAEYARIFLLLIFKYPMSSVEQ